MHDDNSFHGKETNGPKYPLKDPPLSLELHGWCEIERIPSTVNNQQKPIVQHMEFCSVLCARLDGRGVWRRMDTCVCMAESLHCSPETITTLLISYTAIRNGLALKKLSLKK